MPAKKTIINNMAYLGAAISEGQPKPGTHLGPDIYREAGLLSGLKSKYKIKNITDYGNVSLSDIPKSEIKPTNQPFNILNADVLPPLLKRLSKKIQEINSQPDLDFLLTVGGDHSIGSATISGMLNRYKNLKVIWVDAHADMVNPEHAVRDQYNYHGMPLGHVAGCFKLNGFEWMNLLPPENIVLIGIRDIEDGEYETIKKHNVRAYSMEHVEKFGIGEIMKQTMQYLDPKGESPFHISFDVDGLDPEHFSRTGTLFRHGLTGREGCHIVTRIAQERKLVSMDLVETNPLINPEEEKRRRYREEHQYDEVSKSIGLGIDVVESAFIKYLTLL